jgi:hypothetical protein
MNKLLFALMLMLGASICGTGCDDNPRTNEGKPPIVALAPTDKTKQDRQDQPKELPQPSTEKEAQPTLFIEGIRYAIPFPTPEPQRAEKQRHEPTFAGRFLMKFSGAGHGSTSWNFTENHKAIENGEEMGTWQQKGDKVVITYHNKSYGLATVAFQNDDKLVGQNTHSNGMVFNWVLERMTTPPKVRQDIIDLMKDHLVRLDVVNKGRAFVVDITPLTQDKKLITPFVIPAGLVFCPTTNPRCQNMVVIKSLYCDNLLEKRRISIPVCCANQERPFDPTGNYKLERLEPCRIQDLCVELSYSPMSWGECQQRVWNTARQCPLKR